MRKKYLVLASLLYISGLSQAAHNPLPVGSWPEYRRGEPYAIANSSNYIYLPAGDLQVFDVTDPIQPKRVGWCPLDKDMARSIAVAGNYAYVTSDSKLVQIIDIRDPTRPEPIGQFVTAQVPLEVVVSGNYAYVAMMPYGLHVLDISNPAQPLPVGYSGSFFREMALAGDNQHLLIHGKVWNVSNPAKLTPVGDWIASGAGINYNLRVSGSYAYMVTEKQGLVVMDVSNPVQPQVIGNSTPLGTGGYGLAVMDSYAYVVSATRGLAVVDINQPDNPRLVGTCLIPEWGFDLVLRGHYAFVAANGLVVIDVADPTTPQIVSTVYNGDSQRVALSGAYAYVADGLAGVQIIDVRNAAQPQLVQQWTPGGSIADIVIRDQYGYVANRDIGLQILDLSQANAPRQVGECSEISRAASVTVAGDYAYVANGDFVVIDIRDPTNPQWVGGVFKGALQTVALSSHFAYTDALDNTFSGLKIIDIQDPLNPQLAGEYPTTDAPMSITISDHYAYLAEWFSGLEILDLQDPLRPQKVGSNFSLFNNRMVNTRHVTIRGTTAYVANSGLVLLDIANPAQPRRLGGYSLGGNGVMVEGNKAYVAAGHEGMVIFDLDPPPPRLEPEINMDGAGFHVKMRGLKGQWMKLQRSPDLKSWRDWRTFTATGRVQETVDQDLTLPGQRFYRLIEP